MQLNAAKQGMLLGLLSLCWLSGAGTALALVTMDTYTINHAIKYGAIKQDDGYQALLGPNWKTGPNGALLNVYTPYMALAAKAMALRTLPTELAAIDGAALKKAKARLRPDIRHLKDDSEAKQIKFSLSLLGDSPVFHKGYKARLEGTGQGREYALSPSKISRPKAASPFAGGSATATHDVIVGFYFPFAQVARLEGPYQLIITDTERDPAVEVMRFRLNNDELY